VGWTIPFSSMLWWVTQQVCTDRRRNEDHWEVPLITIWRSLWSFPHTCKDLAKQIFLANYVSRHKGFVGRCNSYQRHRNINSRNAMPLKTNLQIELFDVWGIDYIGPFRKCGKFEYKLVAVDYVSKWVEALPCRSADHKSSVRMFEQIIFPRFGTPRLVIIDRGSHSIDKCFDKYLMNHGIQHNVPTPYHLQTSGQAETSNKQIKKILLKTVDQMGIKWKDKLPEALWAYRTAYKTPLECLPTNSSTGRHVNCRMS
jgi:hypothetical protein